MPESRILKVTDPKTNPNSETEHNSLDQQDARANEDGADTVLQPAANTSGGRAKKTSSISSLVVALIAVALAIVLAAAVWLYVDRTQQNSTSMTASQSDGAASSDSPAAQIIAELSSQLSGTTPDSSAAPTYAVPHYKPAGYDFFVAGDPSETVSVAKDSTNEQAQENLSIAKQFLETKQFTLREETDPELAENSYDAVYDSQLVTCQVSFQNWYKDDVPAGTKRSLFEIGCADVGGYDERAAVIAPFAAAHKAGSDLDDYVYGYSLPNITKSPVAGYERAWMNVGSASVSGGGGFAALFYRTPGNEVWEFFRGTQEALSCEEYSTPELRKAFAGEQCFEGDQQRTVISG